MVSFLREFLAIYFDVGHALWLFAIAFFFITAIGKVLIGIITSPGRVPLLKIPEILASPGLLN
jgi:hypothetical protein